MLAWMNSGLSRQAFGDLFEGKHVSVAAMQRRAQLLSCNAAMQQTLAAAPPAEIAEILFMLEGVNPTAEALYEYICTHTEDPDGDGPPAHDPNR